MGAAGIIGLCSIALAAGCGCLLGVWAAGIVQTSAQKAKGLKLQKDTKAHFIIQSVSRPFLPFAERIAKRDEFLMMHQEALMVFSVFQNVGAIQLASELMGVTLSLMLVCLIITKSFVFALAVGGILIAGFWSFVHHQALSQKARMREHVPSALRLLSDCFTSGHPLPQTMHVAAESVQGSLGAIFRRVENRLLTGASVHDALAPLKESSGLRELSFIAVALDVQHTSGGSIGPVLDSAREAVEGNLELSRTLRVQTAQAKLSATMVTLMPFVLVALFSLIIPDFLAPFFSSALGVILLSIALLMQIGGVLIVRRICKVDA